MLPEEVMYFHLGLGLIVAADIIHRLVLPIELAFFPSCGRGVISIYGQGSFCVENQGISRTEVILH